MVIIHILHCRRECNSPGISIIRFIIRIEQEGWRMSFVPRDSCVFKRMVPELSVCCMLDKKWDIHFCFLTILIF